ncbi:MAG: endonuclease III [Melioribacteraceae bacterium]|nr:endonuclease III [Melioribacteraceae bacterium]MCF8355090.1 endonuclease III [Melioribacteraceae bacterium]MCF8395058.1 endonuclease III [Melioribacteraceae bacterium]MCF8420308.1 endonuclease III [Melioribacteraceae bacterium]
MRDNKFHQMIKTVNKLLINKFGIPKKNKKDPDPVDMMIATILSQNTNDNNSYKAYKNLRSRYKTWEEILKARVTSIEKEIRIAGLGKQKSNAIKNFLVDLKKKTGSLNLNHITKMEENEAISELINYKGVGVKTASCVLLFSMGRNVCPVDTHVHRTVNRIGIVNEKSPDKTFFALNKNFPQMIAHSFHTNLIRLGREICKPKKPSCGICPLEKLCQFDGKNFENSELKKENSFMLLDNV